MSDNQDIVFAPLGGLGEVGMNCALYGFGVKGKRKWLMVDLGLSFGEGLEQPNGRGDGRQAMRLALAARRLAHIVVQLLRTAAALLVMAFAADTFRHGRRIPSG